MSGVQEFYRSCDFQGLLAFVCVEGGDDASVQRASVVAFPVLNHTLNDGLNLNEEADAAVEEAQLLVSFGKPVHEDFACHPSFLRVGLDDWQFCLIFRETARLAAFPDDQ